MSYRPRLDDPRWKHIYMAINSHDNREEILDTLVKDISNLTIDHEIVTSNIRLAKQKQQFQDSNRIERKAFREYARVENAVAQYSEKLVEILEKYNFHTFREIKEQNHKAAGVLQISDMHLNELIDLANNKYDFKVASQRLKLFIQNAKKYFILHGITDILVANTGDTLNSDRRVDELLAQATNRSMATFIAVDLIKQSLEELAMDFNVSYATVTGNESRMHKDIAWNPIVATDNYDMTIHEMLRRMLGDEIDFITGDPTELVVKVADQNLLLLHGNGGISDARIDKDIQRVYGRYANKGILLDYVINGHIHSARLGDLFARSSSMCGANDYSEKGLNLSGRASQNCYIFFDNGNRDGIKIDLQNTDDIEGYDIEDSLQAYNSKSLDKLQTKRTVFEVVI